MARAVARAQHRAYGRERARARVESGRFAPHPGWRHRLDAGLVVLTDQAGALARAEQLLDVELWQTDKRARWSAMLRALILRMDWDSGLVCGLTRDTLAVIGRCSVRTVSRLLAWAQDAGLLVVIECGASAAFLGSRTNRAPAYALVATPPTTSPGHTAEKDTVAAAPAAASAQLTDPGDNFGNLPLSYVGNKPLTNNRRLDDLQDPKTDWPAWRIPATPTERDAALSTLLRRIGLDRRGVPRRRARGLLRMWWDHNCCLAGLLYMLDHHPDHHTPRGDALRGALDPIRVLGHRLQPWTGRLDALPAHLTGRHGDYLTQQARQLEQRIIAAAGPAL